MADKKPKNFSFITPRATFIFPKLHKFDTKFKAEGQYSVKSRIPGDAEDFIVGKEQWSVQQMLEKLEEIRDKKYDEVVAAIKSKELLPKLNDKERAAKLKALKKADIFTMETDEKGEETGNIILNPKMTASGKSKKDGKPWTRSPKLFDAKGKKLDPVPPIFGGSEGKVACEAAPYFAPGTKDAPPVVGVTFYLEAVQILKLVKAGDRDAGSFGFGEEEGFEDDTETFGGSSGDSADDSTDDSSGGDGKAGDEF